MPVDQRRECSLIALAQPGDEVLVITGMLGHGSARYGGTYIDVQSWSFGSNELATSAVTFGELGGLLIAYPGAR